MNQTCLRRPTQRAADGGYAARFLGICLALGFVRFEVSPPSHPPQLTRAVGRFVVMPKKV
jgi:hypothetical protein